MGHISKWAASRVAGARWTAEARTHGKGYSNGKLEARPLVGQVGIVGRQLDARDVHYVAAMLARGDLGFEHATVDDPVAASVLELPLRFGIDDQRSAVAPVTKGRRTTIVGDENARARRSSQQTARLESKGCTCSARDAGRVGRARSSGAAASGPRNGCRDACRPSGAPWGSAQRVRRAAMRSKGLATMGGSD